MNTKIKHPKCCPYCKGSVSQIDQDFFCNLCDWDSTTVSVEMGSMDQLFSHQFEKQNQIANQKLSKLKGIKNA